MRQLRKGTPPSEVWDERQLAENLNIDINMAKAYFKGYHDEYGGGYGDIEKSLILDYIERKQREEREREARYQADLAKVRQAAVLEKQVETLEKQLAAMEKQLELSKATAQAASEEARTASARAWTSIIIAGLSAAIAFASLFV